MWGKHQMNNNWLNPWRTSPVVLTRRGAAQRTLVAAVSATLAASLLAANDAAAQAAPARAPKEGPLEEVIVTARFRQELLQETPIAITAVSDVEIEQRGFTSAYEIGLAVPNTSLRPTQAAFGNTMSAYIRGIGQYDFLPEFEPGVGIYFDDVLHPVTMGSTIDLMDLERVEVLRGPQGTLFGRGSIGGAIRYISKKPQGEDVGEASVLYGDYDRLDIRASYDFAIAENVFARVTGVAKSRDGYQDVIDFACAHPAQAGTIPRQVFNRQANCKLGTQGGEDVIGARAALRFVASEDFEVTLTADYQDDSSEARADTLVAIGRIPAGGSPFAGQLPVPFNFWSAGLAARYGVPYDERFIAPDIYTTYANYSDPVLGFSFRPETALTQQGFSAKAEWGFAENALAELILSYRDFEGHFATDADGSPYNEQTVDGIQNFDSTTAELRFSGRAFDRLDWTVGAFYLDSQFDTSQQVSIPAFVPAPFLVNGFNKTGAENKSGYAHFVFDVTERLSLNAGARYSEDSKDEDFDNSIVVTSDSTSDTHFDWKAGIDFRVTDDFMVYASAATGYRPQAFNPRPFQITQFVPVDGEEATSYELGFKSDLFDRRMRVNIAAFYIDYNQRILPVGGSECLAGPTGNYLFIVPPGTPGAVQDSLGQFCIDANGPPPPGATVSRTFYTNIPAEVSGAELELQWQPVDGLTISGIYGYTDFQGDEVDDPGLLGPNITAVLSDYPIYVPEDNWSMSVAYAFGADNGSTFTPRVDVYGQSEICPTVRNNANAALTDITTAEACTDAYEIMNARVEWSSPEQTWLIAVGVNNVTDEEYYLNKFDLTVFGQPTIEGQPGRPQEWYVQLTRHFGSR
jgi:iron complex outermembrane recepter protein